MSRLVYAAGRPWPQLLGSLLDQLDPLPEAADLGLVYLADPTTEMADLVIAGLKERTGIGTWIGAGSTAVFAGSRELASGGAIVALPLGLPAGALAPFVGAIPPAASGLNAGIAHLPAGDEPASAGAHGGSGRQLAVCPERYTADLSRPDIAWIGGQPASAFEHAQFTLAPTAGTVSGLMVGGAIRLAVGISRGLRPLGPNHRVTGGRGSTLFSLDGLPAADVLNKEVGDLLLRESRILSRQLVVIGTNDQHGDDVVSGVGIVDRLRGSVALADLPPGRPLPASLRFARRDPALALTELAGLARALQNKLGGSVPKAALLYSSSQRGADFFGPGVSETAVLADILGPVPILGIRTRVELAGDIVTRYAAALALVA